MSDVALNEIASLEKQYSEAKLLIARRESALRLYKNRDFRMLLVDGFMLTEAARYVQQSCDPGLGPVERADALAIAQASGHLKRFLSITVQMASVALRDMPDLEEALANARNGSEPLETNDEDEI